MDKKQLTGFAGSIMIMAGVFAPIFNIPVTGSINYYRGGSGDGIILLVLAVLSLALLFAKKYKWLWFTGFGCLGMICYTFITTMSIISDIKTSVMASLPGNNTLVQIKWGWILLILGAVLLIVSAALRERAKYAA